jgi:hypothetical protein
MRQDVVDARAGGAGGRRTMRALGITFGLALSLLLAAPAAAATANYHGYLIGATYTCEGVPVAGPTMTGEVWNLSIKDDAATIGINAFYDGVHHTSFRIPGGVVSSTSPMVADFWGGIANDGATVTMTATSFNWAVFLGYDCAGGEAAYDAVTYIGTVGR